MVPAVGALVASQVSASALVARSRSSARCASARQCRGAVLRVRASGASGEAPAAATAAHAAVPRRGALLVAGVTLLLPALQANAEDAVAVANPEPLGNGACADCSGRERVI